MPTHVNREELERYKATLPGSLNRFLDSFFREHVHLDPATAYLRYLGDVKFHQIFHREYREHGPELLKAFYDITGWQPGRDM
ncbi:MAG: hypothetical protein HY645_13425 [Acidobacteria bacterium]|nr:hypothetical protein [Acidobacteriota bacterium]